VCLLELHWQKVGVYQQISLQQLATVRHGFIKAAELYSNTTISDRFNYILPNTIGYNQQYRNGAKCFVLSGKLQNCPEISILILQ